VPSFQIIFLLLFKIVYHQLAHVQMLGNVQKLLTLAPTQNRIVMDKLATQYMYKVSLIRN
jgi:hypothetical protein